MMIDQSEECNSHVVSSSCHQSQKTQMYF